MSYDGLINPPTEETKKRTPNHKLRRRVAGGVGAIVSLLGIGAAVEAVTDDPAPRTPAAVAAPATTIRAETTTSVKAETNAAPIEQGELTTSETVRIPDASTPEKPSDNKKRFNLFTARMQGAYKGNLGQSSIVPGEGGTPDTVNTIYESTGGRLITRFPDEEDIHDLELIREDPDGKETQHIYLTFTSGEGFVSQGVGLDLKPEDAQGSFDRTLGAVEGAFDEYQIPRL